MPDLCYLCGKPATNPLELKNTFTAHSSARAPTSDKMCDRCQWSINLRCWYYNPNKQQWSAIYGRGFSWLLSGDTPIAPTFGESRTENAGKQGTYTLPTVSNLPTRAEMRDWLLNPPQPPFTIAIAESGQKHILFLAQEAHDRDRFPVQFELDTLHIDRAAFTRLMGTYEALMGLEFTKTEIDSGDYRSDRLMKCLEGWEPLEAAIESQRGTRQLQLISHTAHAASRAGGNDRAELMQTLHVHR